MRHLGQPVRKTVARLQTHPLKGEHPPERPQLAALGPRVARLARPSLRAATDNDK